MRRLGKVGGGTALLLGIWELGELHVCTAYILGSLTTHKYC